MSSFSPLASDLSRRGFLTRAAATGAMLAASPHLLWAQEDDLEPMAAGVIARAEELAGVTFDDAERELMGKSVAEQLQSLRAIRELRIPNHVPPALSFRPRPPGLSGAVPTTSGDVGDLLGYTDGVTLDRPPADLEDLAFAPLSTLSHLLRQRKLRSVELTHMFLARLRRLNEKLECVINFTEERALEQAARADEEIAQGKYRGPLHGIPWGAKDILTVEGTPTTWGAAPFKDQLLDQTATVVSRLDDAGAVLVAKTSVGALAWGDVWFGGTTKNPWNLEQGSSGSSAGSASAVAAGALPFALGTETLGSIVSPCTRCGASGIRPTFGRVPRSGCMALTWSMDKIGPIARSAEDAAMVLDAIHGEDGGDPDAYTMPLSWRSPRRLRELRVGYVPAALEGEYDDAALDQAAVQLVRELGVELSEVELPDLPAGDMLTVLTVEAAAAFEELTVSNRDDELVRQVEQAWPNVFRAAHMVPAVQYVQAQRARTLLMRRFDEALGQVDVLVTPSFRSGILVMTNLTGHPAVVVPSGFRENGTPASISFVAGLYKDAEAVMLAAAYQRASGWHRRHPEL